LQTSLRSAPSALPWSRGVAFAYFRRQPNAMEASLKVAQDGLAPQQRRWDDERQRDLFRDHAVA
jgi:hypothetical protein